MGRPTAVAFGQRDVRQGLGSLPVSENIHDITVAVPWFKHLDKPVIKQYCLAFRKVIENADTLKDRIWIIILVILIWFVYTRLHRCVDMSKTKRPSLHLDLGDGLALAIDLSIHILFGLNATAGPILD